jgi:hypothetical protein
VEVTLMAQPGRKLVHLINFPLEKPLNTGWRHMGRNLVPVHDVKVRLALEQGQRVSEARLATNEQLLPLQVAGGYVEVNVPRLVDHEIVVLELA